MQRAQGFTETADIIYEDRTVENLRTDGQMMTVGDVEGGTHTVGQWRKISGCADADGQARVFADRSLDTWDWLDRLGCPFIQANISKFANVYRGSRYYTTTAPQPVNREGAPTDMQAGGAGLIWPMYDEAVKHGAEFFMSHKMTALIREGDRSGRVVGVEVQAGEKILDFRARKAVFLGSGSWNGSKNLKPLFLPWLSEYPHVSGEPYVFNDGSGIEAALEAGASADHGPRLRLARLASSRRHPLALDQAAVWPAGHGGAQRHHVHVRECRRRALHERADRRRQSGVDRLVLRHSISPRSALPRRRMPTDRSSE